jgi:hypothetical protein
MRAIWLSVCVAVVASVPSFAQQKPPVRTPAAPAKGGALAGGAAKPAAAAAEPEPLPTVEQIEKALQSGEAAEALKQVNRLLTLRGKAAEAYDKYELLTLKGEAHLRLKANDAAAVSFRQAANETEDRQKKAVARATEQLIRRSRNLAYTPKKVARGDKAEPIDLVDADSRHKALGAMFVDEVTPMLPKFESAKAATSVGPLIKAMAAAREMEYLELAANGSADQINGIVEGLKEQGKSMLSKVLEKATKRVDRITTLANDTERVRQVVPLGTGGYRSVMVEKRRGVQHDDVTELKGIIDACDEVAAQATALGQSTEKGAAETEELVDGAQDLKVHVQRMLRVHDIEYRGRQGDRDD